jgi:hypothetical protein
MKLASVTVLALLFFTTFTFAQDSLQARIILIGDAGQLTKGHHPVVAAIRNSIPLDKKTTVVFLGDNLYKTGLPDDAMPSYQRVKAPLDSQVVIAKGTDAKVYFIPGNHDWNNGKKNGWEAVVREQYYIDLLGDKNVKYFPEEGCPGPVEVNITPDVVLVIIDSQWWVHPYDKPGVESDCPYKTKEEVLTSLGDILNKNSKKLVVLAMHHTLKSYGIHGGYFKLKQHIFPFTDAVRNLYIPLPVLGSIYPITRSVFGTSEDLAHPYYASMIADLEEVIRQHQNIINVAGHEHTLQLLKDSGYYYIVSGTGSKSNRVSSSRYTHFESEKNGFATLEISKNKNVNVSFYTVEPKDSGFAKKAYTENILNFSSIPTPENPRDTTRQVEFAFKDSVVISASDKYKNPSGFKKTFLGNNYRKEWSTPIKLKEFNISKEKGGFKIVSLGGGKQTKSLKLADKRGKEWTLRSIDKNPENIIPETLSGSLANDIVQDMTSASYPYAPFVVENLAKATEVVTAPPQFFFVPDDPALGLYRKLFANTVCMLEEREPTSDSSDTKSTAKVISKMIDDNDHRADQPEVLKARLLDNLIGDWERHFDQWKWGIKDTGKGKLYYPVPRDRDQAFFYSDGALIKFVSKNYLRFLQGFKSNIPDIKWFNWIARDFDRIFLNELTQNQWINISDSFVHALPDNVIEQSVRKLPPEIYPISSGQLINKLKGRRDILKKDALSYYDFLAKEVTIAGSNKAEYFHVQNSGDSLQVIVYDRKRTTDMGTVVYNRVFDSHTKEIRLFGLNGNDKFEIDDAVNSRIKLRIIGGKGDDTFNIRGNVKNHIYDISSEKNAVLPGNKSRVHFSSDPMINEYRTTGYNYNYSIFPLVNIGYNAEDKLLLGVGFARKTFGFRKDPYATYQKLSAVYAVSRGGYKFKYQGIFNSVISGNDIVVNADLVRPTLNNFFGLGNTSLKSSEQSDDFYRVKYNYVQADLLLRKRPLDMLEVSFGPSYYHYWSHYSDNVNRILSHPSQIGTDSMSIYSVKDYIGAKLKIDINYINNELFPTRGVLWFTELSSLASINKNNHSITKLTSDMQVFAPLIRPNRLVAILRLGGGRIFNDNIEYFQALNLGANNFNRGFRKNRFSGTSMLYTDAELRIKLFTSQSYLLPGDVGLVSFYDVGRVWLKNEHSQKWHQSFGGGIYYAPYNLAIISATIGLSDEDALFNFSLGTKFNLTF